MRARNHYVLIVFDSCRYDSFLTARPRTMRKLGKVERRWSYASWTAPSHYNLLMGLMPHTSPRNVYASEYYKNDFFKFNERLGEGGIEFKSFVPRLYLPVLLQKLGYRTNAMVSLPDEPEDEWPRISGVHGVFKHLDEAIVGGKLRRGRTKMFDNRKLGKLRDRQIEAVKYLDGVVEELFDLAPKNTYITITSDHGELFGEEGYFGHGPIQHEKVFEVFLVEGKLR